MTATFAIVGSGWRAEFFRSLSALFPAELELVGAVVRRPERAEIVAAEWGVPTVASVAELMTSARPDFVITSVPWDANAVLISELVAAGAKVLTETPPAPDVDALRQLWRAVGERRAVQVAEQYHLMPGHAARGVIVRRGVIGTPTQVQVSSTHAYHAVSLMRVLLGDLPMGPARVTASTTTGALVDPLSRAGWTGDTEPKPATTTFATFDFGDGRSGLYDFTDNQWHNRLRHRRIVIRGSHGEIADDDVVRATDATTIITSSLRRQQLGVDLNLDGYDTELIAFDGDVVWRNPFLGHRLMDEQIGVSQLLLATARWATDGGAAPYPLEQGCQDHLLGLAIDDSLAVGHAVDVPAEAWNR